VDRLRKDFIAANSQYAKALHREVEAHLSDVSTSVQKGLPTTSAVRPRQLSKADWKSYAAIKQILQIGNWPKNAETNGWNVADERAAVTEQFCAAVKPDNRQLSGPADAAASVVRRPPELCHLA
jgi:hypothetical protein